MFFYFSLFFARALRETKVSQEREGRVDYLALQDSQVTQGWWSVPKLCWFAIIVWFIALLFIVIYSFIEIIVFLFSLLFFVCRVNQEVMDLRVKM